MATVQELINDFVDGLQQGCTGKNQNIENLETGVFSNTEGKVSCDITKNRTLWILGVYNQILTEWTLTCVKCKGQWKANDPWGGFKMGEPLLCKDCRGFTVFL